MQIHVIIIYYWFYWLFFVNDFFSQLILFLSTDYTWWHWFSTRRLVPLRMAMQATASMISVQSVSSCWFFSQLITHEDTDLAPPDGHASYSEHDICLICAIVLTFIFIHVDCCTFYFSSYILYSCFILSVRERMRISSRPYACLLASIHAYAGRQTHAFADTNLRK